MSSIILKNIKDTHNHAKKVAKKIKAPAIILLAGDLGVGKTEWIRGFVQEYLEDKNIIVTSPSYSLVNEYSKKNKKVIHMDFYRLSNLDDLESIAFRDYLNQKNIICVEWGNNFDLGKLEGRRIINIEIKYSRDTQRELTSLF